MTAPQGRVRIVSNGTGYGTTVTVDGVGVNWVKAVEWRCLGADQLAQAVITVDHVEVDVEAEVSE